MLQIALRVLLFGGIVVAVTEVARLWPRLAAVLLFVPIVLPVVFAAIYLRDGSVATVSRMCREALVLTPLSLPLFVPLALAPRLGMSFWGALGLGMLLAAIGIALYLSLR